MIFGFDQMRVHRFARFLSAIKVALLIAEPNALLIDLGKALRAIGGLREGHVSEQRPEQFHTRDCEEAEVDLSLNALRCPQ